LRRILSTITALLAGLALVACSTAAIPGVRTVAAAEAVSHIDGRTVIDVRTPAETAQGLIAGAIEMNLQAPDFRARIDELDRGGSYLLYCRIGNRSAEAAAIMRDLGFTDVIDGGGYAALMAAGAPTAP
jgi:phage shock protein E